MSDAQHSGAGRHQSPVSASETETKRLEGELAFQRRKLTIAKALSPVGYGEDWQLFRDLLSEWVQERMRKRDEGVPVTLKERLLDAERLGEIKAYMSILNRSQREGHPGLVRRLMLIVEEIGGAIAALRKRYSKTA